MIHSVNKLSLAQEIDKRAKQYNRVIDVLLEINIAGEESKEGYDFGRAVQRTFSVDGTEKYKYNWTYDYGSIC